MSDYLQSIEIPLIKVLLKMEHNGAYVDSKFLKKMTNKIQIILDDLKKKIYSFSKENFNINSTQQMANLYLMSSTYHKLKSAVPRKRYLIN